MEARGAHSRFGGHGVNVALVFPSLREATRNGLVVDEPAASFRMKVVAPRSIQSLTFSKVSTRRNVHLDIKLLYVRSVFRTVVSIHAPDPEPLPSNDWSTKGVRTLKCASNLSVCRQTPPAEMPCALRGCNGMP